MFSTVSASIMHTAALLEKYCKAGPRYTSYPTAPYFHPGFTDVDWQTELSAGTDA